MHEKILKLIFDSIDDINDRRSSDKKIIKSLETRLYGEDSDLDSLELITLIVSLESSICEIYDLQITLADDRALSQEISPFSNVKNLLDYIEILINEKLNT